MCHRAGPKIVLTTHVCCKYRITSYRLQTVPRSIIMLHTFLMETRQESTVFHKPLSVIQRANINCIVQVILDHLFADKDNYH